MVTIWTHGFVRGVVTFGINFMCVFVLGLILCVYILLFSDGDQQSLQYTCMHILCGSMNLYDVFLMLILYNSICCFKSS